MVLAIFDVSSSAFNFIKCKLKFEKLTQPKTYTAEYYEVTEFGLAVEFRLKKNGRGKPE